MYIHILNFATDKRPSRSKKYLHSHSVLGIVLLLEVRLQNESTFGLVKLLIFN